MGEIVAGILSDKIGSKVEIKSVNLGLLNRIIINDMVIEDKQGEKMLSVSRTSASISILPLFYGEIEVNAAQLFGTNAKIYKENPKAQLNCQFLIDAFKSKEKKEPSPLNLCVHSLIVRHLNATYDVLSEEAKGNRFDVNHLRIKDFGMNLQLNHATNDSILCTVKRLQLKELNSGLYLHDSEFCLEANKQRALITNASFSAGHSKISFDKLNLEYGHFKDEKKFVLAPMAITAELQPIDFSAFMPRLSELDETIHTNIHIEGDEKQIKAENITLYNDDKTLTLSSSAVVHYPLDKENFAVNVNIERLQAESSEINSLINEFGIDPEQVSQLLALGDIEFSGNASYTYEDVSSDGKLFTDAGNADYEFTLDSESFLDFNIKSDSLNIGRILNDENIGSATFNITAAVKTDTKGTIPTGKIEGGIEHVSYKGNTFHNIAINALSSSNTVKGTVSIDDDKISMGTDFSYDTSNGQDISLNMVLDHALLSAFTPTTEKDKGETLSMDLAADLKGKDIKHLYGIININNLTYGASNGTSHINSINIDARQLNAKENVYSINSDIINGYIQGDVGIFDIVPSITNQFAYHMPMVFHKSPDAINATYNYDFTLSDTQALHNFSETAFYINDDIRISGDVNTYANKMHLTLNAPRIEYSGAIYNDIVINSYSSNEKLNTDVTLNYINGEDNLTKLHVNADAHANKITSNIKIDTKGKNNIICNFVPVIEFKDSLGNMKTDITFKPSQVYVNDTLWSVAPSDISFFRKEIDVHHFRIGNSNSSININGKASTNPNDNIIVSLDDIEIGYLRTLANFKAVRFTGLASGEAIISNTIGNGMPDLNANLKIKNLTVQEGHMGDADIQAHWDKEQNSIIIGGRMVDLYDAQEGLNGNIRNVTGITTLKGWISPSKKDLKIDVSTYNTNAQFLHGFLPTVFKEVNGTVSGNASIMGPFNDVNLIGDLSPNLNLRLRSTNVPYHIEGDTVRFRKHAFRFDKLNVWDRMGNHAFVNGLIQHQNMKNFKYHIDAKVHEFMAYDEKDFNSDKFLATVFVNGDFVLDGSDGHPLYATANVTPTKGSVFAYDAATPDAISNYKFIEFADRDSLALVSRAALDTIPDTPVVEDSLTIVNRAKKNYVGDLYINFNIDLNPACEVKLRMDNIEDGYMRTFGNGQISARWYNKGALQLHGNYNITSGSYRLFLQDIIFRDLAIQPGSLVEFNGNPFDANIHLICHHSIPSVPLSDLTATTAFSQNNKVKVTCILDITGKLGNMDFKFGMDIPNVSEEVRQLVRSMINSEEEMNTQMIYLLGLGRFYPSEFARANSNGSSSSAVNSLLSSTLSGQINQMLSNVIGTNSKWNFGTGVTTGENGWQDLDVEGMLSGRLLDERLLINGNFGYRDNTMTNTTNFIGDFEVKWRLSPNGNVFLKAYNQTNDRYFTKATLNTQGIGITLQHNFELIRQRMREKEELMKHKKKKRNKTEKQR